MLNQLLLVVDIDLEQPTNCLVFKIVFNLLIDVNITLNLVQWSKVNTESIDVKIEFLGKESNLFNKTPL